MEFLKDKLYTRYKIDLSEAKTLNDSFWQTFAQVSFRSFLVSAVSDNFFSAKIKVNFGENSGDPINLEKGTNRDLGGYVKGFAMEFPAQSGKWIEIEVAHNSVISSNNMNVILSGQVGIKDGSNATSDNKTITSAATEVVAARSNRSAEIYNYSAQTLYVGPFASVNDANFAKKCVRMPSGASYEWRDDSALFGRFASTTSDEIVVVSHLS